METLNAGLPTTVVLVRTTELVMIIVLVVFALVAIAVGPGGTAAAKRLHVSRWAMIVPAC